MDKPKRIVDIIVLILLTAMCIYTLYTHYVEGLVIYLNFMLGVILLVLSIGFKIGKQGFSKYAVLLVLVLFSIGIVNFLPFLSQLGEAAHSVFYNYQFSGMNPIALVFLIIYLVINKAFITKLYIRLFKD